MTPICIIMQNMREITHILTVSQGFYLGKFFKKNPNVSFRINLSLFDEPLQHFPFRKE